MAGLEAGAYRLSDMADVLAETGYLRRENAEIANEFDAALADWTAAGCPWT